MFGCACFDHTRNSGKLDPRALKCVFIFSYTLRVQMLSFPSGRSFVTMDVTFRQFEPYFAITPSPLQMESNKKEEMILPSSTVETSITRVSEVGENIHMKIIGHLNRLDLTTYSRRNNRAEEVIMQYLEAESSSSRELSTFSNELELPIAHRKGVNLYQTSFI